MEGRSGRFSRRGSRGSSCSRSPRREGADSRVGPQCDGQKLDRYDDTVCPYLFFFSLLRRGALDDLHICFGLAVAFVSLCACFTSQHIYQTLS